MDVNTQASAAPEQAAVDTTVDNTPAPQPTDIDGISEFSFQGQKFTPEKLAQLLNERQTFEKQYSETKKYQDFAENLEIDLEKVVKDPNLAASFKQIYPKQYHALLDRVLGQRQAASNENAQGSVPKEVQDKIAQLEARLQEFDRHSQEAQIAQSEAYLQKHVDPLFAKYPYADTPFMRDAVFARADQMLAKGYQMTEAAWERLVNDAHLASKKQADAQRQREIKEQLEKSKEGKDSGAGGSAPGQAPQRARTFDEATREALRQVKAL